MPEKTPLVLLPGLLCDAALWAHQTQTLADVADIRVADMTLDDSMAGMAARMLETAPERFALAGLSMGGYVAFEVMRQAPERVIRLALLDTSAVPDPPERREQRLAFMKQVEAGDFQGMTRRLLPMFIHADRLDDAALFETINTSARAVGKDAFLRQQRAILDRPDSRPGLAAITQPTLVLTGRQDALMPLADQEAMAAAIPDARLVVVEDCGHLAPLEQPEAVSAVMRYWLAG